MKLLPTPLYSACQTWRGPAAISRFMFHVSEGCQVQFNQLREPPRVAVGLEQMPAQAVGVAHEVEPGERGRAAGGKGRLAALVQRAGQVEELCQAGLEASGGDHRAECLGAAVVEDHAVAREAG